MSAIAHIDSLRWALAADGWTLAGGEPLKLTLRTKPRGYTGAEVAALLERRQIFCEFADPDYIVFMLTPHLTESACGALLAALRGLPPHAPLTNSPPTLCKSRRVLSPREAMLAPAEALPIDRALGRILAAPCVSCPPAVPILVCGEEIDEAAVRAFRYYGIETIEVVRGE